MVKLTDKMKVELAKDIFDACVDNATSTVECEVYLYAIYIMDLILSDKVSEMTDIYLSERYR